MAMAVDRAAQPLGRHLVAQLRDALGQRALDAEGQIRHPHVEQCFIRKR
jgi:hypothetical protein